MQMKNPMHQYTQSTGVGLYHRLRLLPQALSCFVPILLGLVGLWWYCIVTMKPPRDYYQGTIKLLCCIPSTYALQLRL